MSFQLKAEQKELIKLFNESEYIIPDFQRPYSWEYKECYQLYSDIYDAFKNSEDFFLGNIILSGGNKNKDILQVVDGQQRLITLSLWIKALDIIYKKRFESEHGGIKQVLYKDDWVTGKLERRVTSEILETKDDDFLNKFLQVAFSVNDIEDIFDRCFDDKKNKIIDRRFDNSFEKNIIYFYYWSLNDFKDNTKLRDFITFLLKNVMLLPIRLDAGDENVALDRALSVFENINDRGIDLSDSDIFKSTMYKKALQHNVEEGKLFISQWVELRDILDRQGLNMDYIFRIYSHIIRGKEKIITSEIGLRKFFLSTSYSPLQQGKNVNDILGDLHDITSVCSYITEKINSENELSMWFQIIDGYSNKYPKIALIVFLYHQVYRKGIHFDKLSSKSTINFCKKLVRYVYSQGATAGVKSEIFSMIKNIIWDLEIDDYYDLTFDKDVLEKPSKILIRGFSLLAYYLLHQENDIQYIKPYDKLTKIISPNSSRFHQEQYHIEELYGIHNSTKKLIDSLGNYIFFDKEKFANNFDILDIEDRNNKIVSAIVNFMQGNERENYDYQY